MKTAPHIQPEPILALHDPITAYFELCNLIQLQPFMLVAKMLEQMQLACYRMYWPEVETSYLKLVVDR